MEEILHQFVPLFVKFFTSHVVQDFFHEQYDGSGRADLSSPLALDGIGQNLWECI